jgi:hypothetical protein
MKKEQTYLQFVIELVFYAEANNFTKEEKADLYERLEENYQMRMDLSYRQGFTAGKFEGTNEAIKLLNTK